MKEFTFNTSNMSNITLYTAANTTFNTSDMSNITLYTATNTTFDTSDMRNKGLKSNLFCLYTHINRMKSLPHRYSHSIYTVDPNTKSLNYIKIRLKALNYFELQQTLK